MDYRKLNEGKFNDEYSGDDFGSKQGEDFFQLYDDNDRDFDGDEYEHNAWGTSHYKEQGYRGDDPYLMDDGKEVFLLRRELEELNQEEALLKKRTVADDLRRQVAEKRASIAALRDKNKVINILNKKETVQRTKRVTRKIQSCQ